MRRKIGLDLVRVCAIFLVLGSHFIKSLDFLGIYGVELFFALSGFLIGGILYRTLTTCGRWSLNEVKVFWLRRWWRTLPNYYLFLAVSLLFHHYYGGSPTTAGLLPYFVFSQNLFGIHSMFYGVSWSLCVEEWFYLTFPLCILCFTSLRASKRTAFVVATLLFLIVPPVLRETLFPTSDPATIRLTTIPRLDAIFYGVAMAFASGRYAVVSSCKFILFAAAGVGLVGLFLFQHHCFRTGDQVSFYRVAFVGLPLCFSLTLPCFAALGNLPVGFAFLARPITALSLWSYSIYLSHIPILTVVYSLFGEARGNAAINMLSKIVGLAICIFVSKLIYEYFESKLMRLRPGESRPA